MQTYTAPLEVVPDPNTSATGEEIASSVDMQLRIQSDVGKVSGMINRLEWMRKQLDDIRRMVRSDHSLSGALKDIDEIDEAMQKVEYKLIGESLTYSDDKYYMHSFKIYFDLLWLNAEIGPGGGDVAGGENFGPTDTAVELLKEAERELTMATAGYETLRIPPYLNLTSCFYAMESHRCYLEPRRQNSR